MHDHSTFKFLALVTASSLDSCRFGCGPSRTFAGPTATNSVADHTSGGGGARRVNLGSRHLASGKVTLTLTAEPVKYKRLKLGGGEPYDRSSDYY
jgi:hypothetical protein